VWVLLQSVCQKSGRKVVTAVLEDGRRFEGDILIGADGIWSKVYTASSLTQMLELPMFVSSLGRT
jgi:2-polyprenyl-6-methoxyphenol hydroxylase-like FAD-dependent oxidoreductase